MKKDLKPKPDNYDDFSRCVKCQGTNKYQIKGFIDYIVSEVSTKCDNCRFENYWACGHYQYK